MEAGVSRGVSPRRLPVVVGVSSNNRPLGVARASPLTVISFIRTLGIFPPFVRSVESGWAMASLQTSRTIPTHTVYILYMIVFSA